MSDQATHQLGFRRAPVEPREARIESPPAAGEPHRLSPLTTTIGRPLTYANAYLDQQAARAEQCAARLGDVAPSVTWEEASRWLSETPADRSAAV